MERIVNEEPVGRGAVRERPGRAPGQRETVVPIAHAVEDIALPAEFVVSPAAVTRTLGALAVALVVAHVVAVYMHLVLGRDNVFGLVPMFDANLEANVPTWYSSFLLLVCGGLSWAAGAAARRAAGYAGYWRMLALGFVLLSVDETATIHEMVGRVSRLALRDLVAGHLAFAAVAGVVGLVLLAAYARFLRDLRPATRRRLLIAGGVYVGSALVWDLVGDAVARSFGPHSVQASVAHGLEELGETIGVILIVYALLCHLRDAGARLQLAFDRPSPASSPPR